MPAAVEAFEEAKPTVSGKKKGRDRVRGKRSREEESDDDDDYDAEENSQNNDSDVEKAVEQELPTTKKRGKKSDKDAASVPDPAGGGNVKAVPSVKPKARRNNHVELKLKGRQGLKNRLSKSSGQYNARMANYGRGGGKGKGKGRGRGKGKGKGDNSWGYENDAALLLEREAPAVAWDALDGGSMISTVPMGSSRAPIGDLAAEEEEEVTLILDM